MQPLAAMVVSGEAAPGSTIRVTLREDGQALKLEPARARKAVRVKAA
jgi:hypothetical protein